MKILKNPFIAFIIAVLLVLSSTVLSVYSDIKHDRDDLLYYFYHGENSKKDEDGIHGNLLKLCNLTEAIMIHSDKIGIDSSALRSVKSQLENQLLRTELEIEDIYEEYVSLSMLLEGQKQGFSDAPLSISEKKDIAQLFYEADLLSTGINNSKYNSMRTRFAEELNALELFLIELFDLDIPGYFI